MSDRKQSGKDQLLELVLEQMAFQGPGDLLRSSGCFVEILTLGWTFLALERVNVLFP